MVPKATGQTLAQRFNRLDTAGQRQDMIDAGVSFTATKDGTGHITVTINTDSAKTQAYIHALNLKTS